MRREPGLQQASDWLPAVEVISSPRCASRRDGDFSLSAFYFLPPCGPRHGTTVTFLQTSSGPVLRRSRQPQLMEAARVPTQRLFAFCELSLSPYIPGPSPGQS